MVEATPLTTTRGIVDWWADGRGHPRYRADSGRPPRYLQSRGHRQVSAPLPNSLTPAESRVGKRGLHKGQSLDHSGPGCDVYSLPIF
jgi:hypothetical protein